MTKNHFRLFLIFTFCGIAAAGVLWFPGNAEVDKANAAEVEQQASGSLTIGSPAPALDIEHWIQDGNGFFEPVTTFEPGKVYVVEFWATWCGPCINSMPHLAALQNMYRGRGVQIVSVSDEPLKTVKGFLEREAQTPDGETTTFAEITAAYSLTTDPDRSVYEAYMDASEQQGIPTAFIVGKDGKVEWIGHPMEMDGPLEEVVTDSWDRTRFATMLKAEQKFNTNLQKISKLAGTGQFKEAIDVIDAEIKSDLPEEIRDRWVMIRERVKLSAGMVDEDVIKFFKNELEKNKGEGVKVASVAWMLYQASREVQGLDELLTVSITALKAEVPGVDDQSRPVVLDTLAHLYEATGDLDAAIQTQQSAVDATEGRTQQRLARYLDELKEKKGEPASEADAK
jgi:thiol-disulfide isomerase/thioredoxin/cell fate (sporulation/competence/biofilm development) regulator YmcA (YheA/YmcA/DUF963 family)